MTHSRADKVCLIKMANNYSYVTPTANKENSMSLKRTGSQTDAILSHKT